MRAGPARILDSLRRAAGPCSGERLSDELGVSRAQVWKHVEALRGRGYAIEGEPGGGYRLVESPDRLYPEEIAAGLETEWLAREIEYYDETDSTNRVAIELAQKGAAHGHAVIAEGQSQGRGRLGRSFYSPPHLNLYTSIVLRPALDVATAPTLIPTAAIAVADAVAQTIGQPQAVEIKWPNDVLLGGLKTSGILMEMGAEATRVGYAVLGIGVNLNVERADFPEDFRQAATSLRSHTGAPVDRAAFARRLYCILEGCVDAHARGGFASLRERYEAYFHMAGREVRVLEMDGSELAGVALGIDDHGALRIERASGEEIRVIAGDVTVAKGEPRA